MIDCEMRSSSSFELGYYIILIKDLLQLLCLY